MDDEKCYFYKDEDWENADDPYVFNPSEYDRIDNPNKLYDAWLKSKKSVIWKTSVQRYELNLLTNITRSYYSIENGTYFPKESLEFTLNERGHKRAIKAVRIEDRVVQRSLNDNVLIPSVANYLIYDNGASQTGKGITFARNEFEKHLFRAHMYFGENNGYILFIDFSKYFDNIIHSIMLEYFRNLVSESEYNFIKILFDQFKIDVSYMTDDEYANCLDNLFISLEYDLLDKSLRTGDKFMEKSVGIGNQMSQIAGIYYPYRIDNYIRIVKGYTLHGRYMDDSYIMARTKEELKRLLRDIIAITKELGIHINLNKTRIVPLSSNLTYLKINYLLTKSGRIISTVPRETLDREIDRLYKFKELYLNGKMPLIDIIQCFISWYGTYSKYDNYDDIQNIEYMFRTIFGIVDMRPLNEIASEMIQSEKDESYDKYKSMMSI